MTKKTFLEITDLPQDNLNLFHGLRTPLIKVFNSCREQPYKMTAFKGLLKFMYNTVVSFEALTADNTDVKSTIEQVPSDDVKVAETGLKSPETAINTSKTTQKDAK